MSRPRFLADHNLNEHIVTGVIRQEPGLEFVRARELQLDRRTDVEILNYAELEGLLVISHDVNTMRAAAYLRVVAGQSFSGLFMVQQSAPLGPVIESIVLIWAASELEEWKDQVVFLPFD